MICYVESGVEFTNELGDINEGFYSSLESVYASALKLIEKNKLHENFKLRAEYILKDTKNIGWGFHYSLAESYEEVYK